MTQAEELAYWEGHDGGSSRDGIMPSHCRYHDPGLIEAYETGWYHGTQDRTGKPWTFPDKPGSIIEVDLSSEDRADLLERGRLNDFV